MRIKSNEIKLINTEEIIPHEKNRNKHPKDQIERLVKIIQNSGFRQPLVVSNLSGKLISGHGRLMAAKKLKMEKVPVIFQDFSSEDEEYQHLTADNAIANWAELDFAGINDDIANLGPDFDIDTLGIKNFKIDFEPGTEEEQGKLDELKMIIMECPHCGEKFEKKQAKIID